MTSSALDGNEREHRELHRDGAGDDPGEARLAAREVEADEDVHERIERHRQREQDEEVAAVRELGAEARAHEPATGHPVEQGQERAERCRHEERPSENVLRVLSARLTGGRHREEHRQDRRGEEERDAREGRRRCVLAGDVRREAGLDDEEIDGREHRDADEADEDGPEVAEERSELRGGHAALRASAARVRGQPPGLQPRCPRSPSRTTAPPRRKPTMARSPSRARRSADGNDLHRGDRHEALVALEHAHRDRERQRDGESESSEQRRRRATRSSVRLPSGIGEHERDERRSAPSR